MEWIFFSVCLIETSSFIHIPTCSACCSCFGSFAHSATNTNLDIYKIIIIWTKDRFGARRTRVELASYVYCELYEFSIYSRWVVVRNCPVLALTVFPLILTKRISALIADYTTHERFVRVVNLNNVARLCCRFFLYYMLLNTSDANVHTYIQWQFVAGAFGVCLKFQSKRRIKILMTNAASPNVELYISIYLVHNANRKELKSSAKVKRWFSPFTIVSRMVRSQQTTSITHSYTLIHTHTPRENK